MAAADAAAMAHPDNPRPVPLPTLPGIIRRPAATSAVHTLRMTARPNPLDTPGKEFTVNRLLDSGLVTAPCGLPRNLPASQRGRVRVAHALRVSVSRRVPAPRGGDQAVADANHVLFFNQGQGYQVSHPVIGRRRQPGAERGRGHLARARAREPGVRRRRRSRSTSSTCASMRARRRW